MTAPADLISTLKAISTGQTTAAKVIQECLRIANSPACDQVFMSIQSANDLASQSAAGALGLLQGLPFSAKDLFDVAGDVTLAGSKVLKNTPAALQDSPAVASMRQAGGALIGRTNMVEFAFSGVGVNPHYGTPAAWDAVSHQPAGQTLSDANAQTFEPLVPGGSSSGAAVSVATAAAFIGLGSDTGGSIRIPAALNGIVGFKNTARRVPTQGAVPLSSTMDTVCAMTRSVRDGILAHEILAYRKVPRFDRPLSSYTIGVPKALMLDQMSAPVSLAWERSLKVLAQAGAKLVDIPLTPIHDLAGLLATGGFSAAESYTWHRHLLDHGAADYDPRVAQRIARGAQMKAHEYLDLQKGRQEWIGRMKQAMQGLDVLLSPTLPITAPSIASMAPGAERDDAFFASNALLLRNTSVVNMLDGCALSLPCHRAGELPVSLMVWQGPMADDVVLNASLAVEHALNMST